METGKRDGSALAETAVFLQCFKDMPDRRQPGKVRYPLDEILLLCLLAVLAGAAPARCVPILRRGLTRMQAAPCKKFTCANPQALAEASGISLPAIKRLEQLPGPLAAQSRTVDAIIAAFEKASVEFVDEDGGGPGVRLKPGKRKKGK